MACPRCGIDPTSCECQVASSSCFSVSGVGSAGSPYTVSPVINPSSASILSCGTDGLLAALPPAIASPSSGQIYSVGTQSIPGGSVATQVGFDSIRYSNQIGVSLPNNRLEITVPGIYVLSLMIGWQPTDIGDFTTQVRIVVNATIVGLNNTRRPTATSIPLPRYQRLVVQEQLAIGDFITAVVSQSSASSLSLISDRASPVLSALYKRGAP